MSKKYLVTGGSGFIGSALVKSLLKQGHKVRVLDNNSRGNIRRIREVLGDIEFIDGDICDPDVVNRATYNQDVVCHLAYVNGTKFFYSKPEIVLKIAVNGMVNLMEACIRNNVGEVVLASSSEVYQTPTSIPTDETAALIVPDVMNPRFSYGAGKIISEVMAVNYGRKYFDRVVIFRPHNVYGQDMGEEHVIPEFCIRMRGLSDGDMFHIQGTGNEQRAFIYIDDFIQALMIIIDKGENLNVYHIGTQDEVSISELVNVIAAKLHKKVHIIPGVLQEGSTIRRCPDITKIRMLGFVPKWNLHDGISEVIKWYI